MRFALKFVCVFSLPVSCMQCCFSYAFSLCVVFMLYTDCLPLSIIIICMYVYNLKVVPFCIILLLFVFSRGAHQYGGPFARPTDVFVRCIIFRAMSYRKIRNEMTAQLTQYNTYNMTNKGRLKYAIHSVCVYQLVFSISLTFCVYFFSVSSEHE